MENTFFFWKILLRMVLNCLKINMPSSELPKLGCELYELRLYLL